MYEPYSVRSMGEKLFREGWVQPSGFSNKEVFEREMVGYYNFLHDHLCADTDNQSIFYLRHQHDWAWHNSRREYTWSSFDNINNLVIIFDNLYIDKLSRAFPSLCLGVGGATGRGTAYQTIAHFFRHLIFVNAPNEVMSDNNCSYVINYSRGNIYQLPLRFPEPNDLSEPTVSEVHRNIYMTEERLLEIYETVGKQHAQMCFEFTQNQVIKTFLKLKFGL